MTSSNSSDSFERELEEAVSGEVYKKFGFKDDPFVIYPSDRVITFTDRDKESSQFAIAFSNMLKKAIPHIAILGFHGIGKTHFLEFLKEVIENKEGLYGFSKVLYIKGESDFKKRSDEIFAEGDAFNALLFVDDMDIIMQRHKEKSYLLFSAFESRLIGTWDTRAWSKLKMEHRLPKTEVIYLDRLEKEDCKELIRKRLKLTATNDTGKLFPDFVLEKLSILSDGNPYRLITRCKKYFNFIMMKSIFEMTSDKFTEFSKELGVTFVSDLKERISKLSERQKDVLKRVLDNFEISAEELSHLINLSRITTRQHLLSLKDKDLLESKVKGNSVKFYVPSDKVEDVEDMLLSLEKSSNTEENKE